MAASAPHVVVLGGGVIGVTCCYELLLRGCRVTLVEAGAAVARKGSFQNGNYLNSQWSPPIANSNFPGEFVRSLWGTGQFLPLETSFSQMLRPSALRWCAHLIGSFGRHAEVAAAGTALAQDTIDRIEQTRARHDSLRQAPAVYRGVLSLITSEEEVRLRRSEGKSIITADELRKQEPVLRKLIDDGTLRGAALNTSALTIDCHEFTERLHSVCVSEYGMKSELNSRALSLDVDSGECTSVRTESGSIDCDRVVVAMGCDTRTFLKPYVSLPILPVGGYSIDWVSSEPILHTYAKVALLKGLGLGQFGDRVRMSGLVHFGDGTHHSPGWAETMRIAELFRARVEARCGLDLSHILPKDGAEGTVCWSCYRPCTPDNIPVIGPVPGLRNVVVCSGHSFSGWGWSMGSAALAADAVLRERRSDLDPSPFSPNRFSIFA